MMTASASDLSRGQAGGAREEAELAARDIFSLTSDPPSFNHDRKII